ncbi:Pecanex-Like Protein 2 [Manis pentadactyla]|nr:Pecanex-Like Protein 2 [Manis pentadactyla]
MEFPHHDQAFQVKLFVCLFVRMPYTCSMSIAQLRNEMSGAGLGGLALLKQIVPFLRWHYVPFQTKSATLSMTTEGMTEGKNNDKS